MQGKVDICSINVEKPKYLRPEELDALLLRSHQGDEAAHLSQFPEYAEEVQLLQDICDELPLIHWSDKSIRDAVAQFILDYGR